MIASAQTMNSVRPAVQWPAKQDLFGVGVTACETDVAVAAIIAAAKVRQPSIVSCFSVHSLVSASDDPVLNRKANSFEMVTADGQPIRWALNLLHKTSLAERVTGRDVVEGVCAAAVRENVSIYLYGSQPHVLEHLQAALVRRFPGLQIAGSESPPFRQLTPEEDAAAIERINKSGAGVVLIGLGCPKQDLFAFAHRPQIRAVQVCVGAVFDFFSGNKSIAPAWMQRFGMEWIWRLACEPRRLFWRYATTNTAYCWKLLCGILGFYSAARSSAMRRQIGNRNGLRTSLEFDAHTGADLP
jgi:N-acetylglucosaminyldiphosphoundecaprenol N-acetyl-beta-D-mannosaminyltransferase